MYISERAPKYCVGIVGGPWASALIISITPGSDLNGSKVIPGETLVCTMDVDSLYFKHTALLMNHITLSTC